MVSFCVCLVLVMVVELLGFVFSFFAGRVGVCLFVWFLVWLFWVGFVVLVFLSRSSSAMSELRKEIH